MAEITTGVIAYLNTRTEVAAIFGKRFTVNRVPDNQAMPYAVLQQIAAPQSFTHEGAGTRVVTIQIDVFDDDLAGVDSAAQVLRTALQSYKGVMGQVVAGRVWITNVRGHFDTEVRAERRILEMEIGTND